MATEREGVIKLERYNNESKQLVQGAQQLADERQHTEVTPLHLLTVGVQRSPGVAAVFRSAGADPAELSELCDKALGRLPKSSSGMAYVSPGLIDLLQRSEREAQRDKSETVGVAQLLNALTQEIRGAASEILSSFTIGPGSLREHLGALDTAPKGLSTSKSASGKAAQPADYLRDLVADARADLFDPVIGRDLEVRRLLQILDRRFKNHPLIVGEAGVGKTAIIRGLAQRLGAGDVPSNLADAQLCELNTGAIVAGAKLYGEIEARLKGVIDKLTAAGSVASILVIEDVHSLFGQGVSGSGMGDLLKPLLARSEIRILATTTQEGVQKINGRDPAVIRRFSSFTIEPPSIEQAQEILRGVAARYEKHHRVRITESAIRTAVTLAKRYVPDRSLPDSAVDLLDETASRKRVEIDGVPEEVDAAMRRLESLKAQSATLTSDDDALSVKTRDKLDAEARELEPKVAEMRKQLESRRGVIAAVRSLRKELAQAGEARDKARDGKDFAKLGELEHVTMPEIQRRLEAAEQAAARVGAEDNQGTIGDADVARTVNDWTGIPVAKMLEGEADKLLRMEERLAQRVVGQVEAVGVIGKAVRRGRVGLRDPGKPIGSFMFLGPSGVGKTELGKALAEFLFDDEQSLTRFDMSEFMERHMAQRLIGAPPGYADSESGGTLTEAVRRKPYSVLLFDEVEKAHADVFNLLLQVLDDGRLTDGRGRVADFSNTVVIMTSNIGSKRILETDLKVFETEEGRQALEDVLKDNLKEFFRPEFLNRIDDIVVFKPLTKTDLGGIVEIQLKRLSRLLGDRDISVELTAAAKDRLIDIGYEPALGARPLKRAILQNLQNPLAEAILRGGAGSHGKMLVDVDPSDSEHFTFKRA